MLLRRVNLSWCIPAGLTSPGVSRWVNLSLGTPCWVNLSLGHPAGYSLPGVSLLGIVSLVYPCWYMPPWWVYPWVYMPPWWVYPWVYMLSCILLGGISLGVYALLYTLGRCLSRVHPCVQHRSTVLSTCYIQRWYSFSAPINGESLLYLSSEETLLRD